MKNNRLLELDGLRGVAALSVVIYHYFYRYNALYGHDTISSDWSYSGKYGVQLFFMVSGFVIFWTLNRVEKPLDFVVSRFSRLFPTFWVAASITFFIVSLFGLPGREVDFVTALFNVIMFHEYFDVKHIDGFYWTLTVELTFYFWIFFIFITRGLKYTEYILLPLIIAAVLQSQFYVKFPPLVTKFFILYHLPYFFAGICFYKVSIKTANHFTYCAILLTLASIFFLYSEQIFVASVLFYLIFYLIVLGKLKILSAKPLVFLGGISYSWYLLHQNIGYVALNKLKDFGVTPYLSIASAMLLTIILAYVVTEVVEKPSLKLIRNRYKDLNS